MDMTKPAQSDALNALLVREAQQEAANLRAELFAARRAGEERRVALEQYEQLKGQLEMTVREQQAELNHMAGQLHQFHGLQQHYQQLESMVIGLQEENATLKEASNKARQEAEQALKAKQAAENSKALLEGERSRLAKSRDELATQLRLAQQRARDAEEEQLRAEEEAAAAQAELQGYQTEGFPSGGPDGEPSVSGATADLLFQLDSERESRLALYDSLQAVKAELSQQNAVLTALHTQLESVREELVVARQQNADKDRELGEVGERMVQLQAELDQARKRQRVLEGQNEKLKAHVLDLQNSLTAEPSPRPPAPHQSDTIPTTNPNTFSETLANGATNPHVHRVASSSSFGGEEDSDSAASLKLRQLEKKMTMFKKSRDKLLAEVDRQSAEMERLGLESKQLQDDLGQARGVSQLWEMQAKSALQQLDQLKDLLEESAQWDSITTQPDHEAASDEPGLPPPPPSSNGGTQPGTPSERPSERESSVMGTRGGRSDGGHASIAAQLQSLLLKERARNAKLDVQVRMLCAELLKIQKVNASLLKSRVPVLAGIESRVAQLHKSVVT